LRADEYTHKYMKTKLDVFPEADIEFVIAKLKQNAKNYKHYNDYLVALIKQLDKNGNGTIEFEDLVIGLKELGFNLTY